MNSDYLEIISTLSEIRAKYNIFDAEESKYYHGISEAIKIVKNFAENEEQAESEWCPGCKEYDNEKHCCHRFTKVIRQTVAECRKAYAEAVDKSCDTCKYEGRSTVESPCCDCYLATPYEDCYDAEGVS